MMADQKPDDIRELIKPRRAENIYSSPMAMVVFMPMAKVCFFNRLINKLITKEDEKSRIKFT